MDKAASPVLLGGMRVIEQRFRMIANNVANMSTGGFRAETLLSSEHVSATGGASVSMPRLGGTVLRAEPGEVRATGAALDFAIVGPGFFNVSDADGTPFLTRTGSFQRSAEGNLQTAEGFDVLDAGGAPIAVPEGEGPVTAAPDGTLARDGAVFGQLGVMLSDGPFERRSATVFAMPADVRAAETASIRQGMLEGSNVSPVQELALMIEASRAYELAQQLVEREDQRVLNVIETFARQQ
ncbi:MAG: flagellar hook-basal body complex protein [Pseudomonadota bacterium]